MMLNLSEMYMQIDYIGIDKGWRNVFKYQLVYV